LVTKIKTFPERDEVIHDEYNAAFTTDIDSARKHLLRPETRVYKLDGLTEIKHIEATFKEIAVYGMVNNGNDEKTC